MNKKFKYIVAGCVALTAVIAYVPALQHNFSDFDDTVYVVKNVNIRTVNYGFFRWAFTDFYAANWHPLTWMSHALDYALWGLNPLGHHLTNIILHAANTFLVVILVAGLLEIPNMRTPQTTLPGFLNNRTILIAAAATGLLFGIHPIHVESVEWVSERKDLLCALFFLLSIIAYLNHAGGESSKTQRAEGRGQGVKRKKSAGFALFTDKRYLTALALFMLALLSKPMAVSLPFVLLILDWYPFGRIRTAKDLWPAGFEKLPFLTLSFVSSVITIRAQEAGGAMRMMATVPLPERLLVAIKSLAAYLGNVILPLHLLPFYPYPKNVSLLAPGYLLAAALVAVISAGALLAAKKQKVYLSSWLYFIVTLVPVIGIVQVGEQAMADRYMYLPALAPFMMIGTGTARISDKTGLTRSAFVAAAGVAIIAGLLVMTLNQLQLRKNPVALWSSFIEKEPDRIPFAYLLRGRAFEKEGQLEKASADYNTAISLNPSFLEAYNSLGVIYGKKGFHQEAIVIFTKAILLNPLNALYYNNRGRSYYHMGLYDKALGDFNKALKLNQNLDTAYLNRGETYRSIRNYAWADSDFRKACSLGNEIGCRASAK